MRNSTVFMFGLALVMSAPVAAEPVSPLKMMKDAKVRIFQKESGVKGDESRVKRARPMDNGQKTYGIKRMSEMAKKLKPGTTKAFGWIRNNWILEDTYTYSYDSSGNVIVENSVEAGGDYVRTVSEYDANNKVTFRETKTSIDGVNYENNKKSLFEYDPILTNVITQRTEWLWMQEEWKLVSNNYKRIITRDEEGNITSVVIAVLFNGIYDPTQRLEITYGADGKATTITEEILGYDGKDFYWEQSLKITDIVWDRTDGQIYSPEDLFIGNNRIGSAHYRDSDDLDMNVTVEYADDSETYTANMAMTMDGMSVTATLEHIQLENDGYMDLGTTYYMGEEAFSTREEYRYDDWGLMTLALESEMEDGYTYTESSVGEVEYDAEGKPLTYTISERSVDGYTGEEVTIYTLRAEYSDYIDVTDNTGAAMIREEAQERCYDLHGLPVYAPEKGHIGISNGKKIIYGK